MREKNNKKYKKRIFSFFLSLVLVLNYLFLSASRARAQIAWESPRCFQTIDGVEVATIQGLECVFRNIVRVLVPLLGIALFIMLIAGAFKYLTSGGEAKKAQEAKNAITYAIFGLIAFFGIWFILKLIQFITGVDVTLFNIPGP